MSIWYGTIFESREIDIDWAVRDNLQDPEETMFNYIASTLDWEVESTFSDLIFREIEHRLWLSLKGQDSDT